MIISSRIVIFALVLFLVGCSSGYKSNPDSISGSGLVGINGIKSDFPSKSSKSSKDLKYNELTFSFKDCMPYVHTARSQGDIPPSLKFIKDISQTIFSCEYFRGRPMRYYKSFGPKLKINGNVVYSGWGYAITDNPNALSGLLNAPNFADYYKGSGDIEVTIKEEPISMNRYSRAFRTYFVRVNDRYFSAQNVAALGILNFLKDGQSYRLFLWIQDRSLTRYEVTRRFRALISIVPIPSISVAKM